MKYIASLLIIFCFAIVGCKSNQKQFITTFYIEDSIATNGQMDTAVLVLKKRLESEKMGYATVAANYKDKQLTIQSGLLDKDWIKSNLLKPGALVFYECYTIADVASDFKEADEKLAAMLAKNKTDSTSNPLFSAFDNIATPSRYDNQLPGYIGVVTQEHLPRLKKYLGMVKEYLPADIAVLLQEETIKNKKKIYNVYFVRDNDTKFFAGNHIQKSEAKPDYNGHPAVYMKFDAYGTYVWKRMTAKNVNKTLVIVIDGNILSAPNVVGPMEDGEIVISGSFEKKETKEMANIIGSGFLPLQLTLKNIEEVKKAE